MQQRQPAAVCFFHLKCAVHIFICKFSRLLAGVRSIQCSGCIPEKPDGNLETVKSLKSKLATSKRQKHFLPVLMAFPSQAAQMFEAASDPVLSLVYSIQKEENGGNVSFLSHLTSHFLQLSQGANSFKSAKPKPHFHDNTE